MDTRTNCTLIHLDYETGKLVHVANVSSACLDFNPMQTSRPQTALDTSRLSSGFPMLLYFSGSGSALHGIDVTTGAVSVVAPAPAKYGFVVRDMVTHRWAVAGSRANLKSSRLAFKHVVAACIL